MSDSPSSGPPASGPSAGAARWRRMVEGVGGAVIGWVDRCGETVRFVGDMTDLLGHTLRWLFRSVFVPGVRLRRSALAYQMVRVGVRSIGIVVLVQIFIGIILALQLAPTLRDYGQLERVADVVAIAVVRELGPLISAIVLSGFAGASIAAEIGAMKEAEEIKALKAHALNPYHFLVMPRLLATVMMLTGLTVIADVVGVFGGFLTSWLVLEVPPATYVDLTQSALGLKDLFTGLFKAGVFGMLIALIACCEGLRVSGGAEGVGRATTATVVKSIVALIGVDALFTAVFYVFEI
ncbi:MAG: ABC transporter permease [Phycisphaerales bacterium]|nr:MAG: ABC transporter permease [Phycisphaerales bacterium]